MKVMLTMISSQIIKSPDAFCNQVLWFYKQDIAFPVTLTRSKSTERSVLSNVMRSDITIEDINSFSVEIIYICGFSAKVFSKMV